MVNNKNNRQEKDKTEPVVGFKLTLYDSANETTSGGKFQASRALNLFIKKTYLFST
jgi:hypothetical protein